MSENQILRFPNVSALTGLSRSTIWRLERESSFPKRVRISAGTVGWRKFEIEQWLETRQTA